MPASKTIIITTLAVLATLSTVGVLYTPPRQGGVSTQEYRERCFKTPSSSSTYKVTVDTTDAQGKIDQSMVDITKFCNATAVQCPALMVNRIVVKGTSSSLYTTNMGALPPPEAATVECVRGYMYGFSVDLSGFPAWAIAVIVISLLLCCCGCAYYIKFKT
ncbi:Hypothetical protein POVN_LOCUS302 [uncultured virus]|nr:Hypothetical protein POVN_LOCUS302 [uncultured virus]